MHRLLTALLIGLPLVASAPVPAAAFFPDPEPEFDPEYTWEETCRDCLPDGTLAEISSVGPGSPPPGWTCDPAYYDAGIDPWSGAHDGCDCGCGVWDPDCDDDPSIVALYCDGYPANGACDPQTNTCQVNAWNCDDASYADGASCDCNCGLSDPDCTELFCDPTDDPFCNKFGECTTATWTGPADRYGDHGELAKVGGDVSAAA